VETPSRQEREWLTAFGVAAVYVVEAPAGTQLSATQDLTKALTVHRRTLGRDVQLARIWWTSNLATALELVTAVTPAAGATIEEVDLAVREAARQRQITLAEHGTTLERARAALARLDRGLELAKRRGILWEFNARFRFLRQKQPQLSYGAMHAKLKTEIARRLAENAGALPDLAGIVDVVLPLK
jgi:hypothetical protein